MPGGYSENLAEFDVDDVDGDGLVTAKDFNYGWSFKMKEGSLLFPAAARYDGTYAMLYGSKSGLWGAYWETPPPSPPQPRGLGSVSSLSGVSLPEFRVAHRGG